MGTRWMGAHYVFFLIICGKPFDQRGFTRPFDFSDIANVEFALKPIPKIVLFFDQRLIKRLFPDVAVQFRVAFILAGFRVASRTRASRCGRQSRRVTMPIEHVSYATDGNVFWTWKFWGSMGEEIVISQ